LLFKSGDRDCPRDGGGLLQNLSEADVEGLIGAAAATHLDPLPVNVAFTFYGLMKFDRRMSDPIGGGRERGGDGLRSERP